MEPENQQEQLLSINKALDKRFKKFQNLLDEVRTFNVNFDDNSKEIAAAISNASCALLLNVSINDIEAFGQQLKTPNVNLQSPIAILVKYHDRLSDFVRKNIKDGYSDDDKFARARMWLAVAYELRLRNDFNSLASIMNVLNQNDVLRKNELNLMRGELRLLNELSMLQTFKSVRPLIDKALKENLPVIPPLFGMIESYKETIKSQGKSPKKVLKTKIEFEKNFNELKRHLPESEAAILEGEVEKLSKAFARAIDDRERLKILDKTIEINNMLAEIAGEQADNLIKSIEQSVAEMQKLISTKMPNALILVEKNKLLELYSDRANHLMKQLSYLEIVAGQQRQKLRLNNMGSQIDATFHALQEVNEKIGRINRDLVDIRLAKIPLVSLEQLRMEIIPISQSLTGLSQDLVELTSTQVTSKDQIDKQLERLAVLNQALAKQRELVEAVLNKLPDGQEKDVFSQRTVKHLERIEQDTRLLQTTYNLSNELEIIRKMSGESESHQEVTTQHLAIQEFGQKLTQQLDAIGSLPDTVGFKSGIQNLIKRVEDDRKILEGEIDQKRDSYYKNRLV